jgi:hypothetical protein
MVYSKTSRRAVGLLFKPYNDMTVFVEDSRLLNVHLNLVRRALPSSARLYRVFALGDRGEVIAAALGDADPTNCYIVDGDLLFVYGMRQRRIANVYILKCYSIENVALVGADLVEIIRDYCVSEDVAAIEKRLNLAEFSRQANRFLKKLFALYAIAHVRQVGIQTAQYSVMRMTKKGAPYCLDEALVNARCAEVEGAIRGRIGAKGLSEERAKVRRSWKRRAVKWDGIISGKTYLLPLLHKRAEVLGRYRGEKDMLLARMSREVDFTVDRGLKSFLRRSYRRALNHRSEQA